MTDMYIRVWNALDLKHITEHLIVAADLTSDCARCKEVGLDYTAIEDCPNCGTHFNYIATRKIGSSRLATVRRIKEKRPDLMFIDYDDYKELAGKEKAKNLFLK